MLHGEWALMNIIIMRGREALRPKQALESLRLLHCKSAPASSHQKSVRKAKKGQKYQFVSNAFLFNKFLCVHFDVATKYTEIICCFYIFLCEKKLCDRKWGKKEEHKNFYDAPPDDIGNNFL